MSDTRAGTTGSTARLGTLALAFVAGFLAVLIFHQLTLGALYLAGVASSPPYSMAPTAPLGVPAVLSGAFWGGLWGIAFALLEPRLPRGILYWVAALLFGAVVLTLAFAFVVAPIKGIPLAALQQPGTIATGLSVNGAWGLGTALLLVLFAKGRTTR